MKLENPTYPNRRVGSGPAPIHNLPNHWPWVVGSHPWFWPASWSNTLNAEVGSVLWLGRGQYWLWVSNKSLISGTTSSHSRFANGLHTVHDLCDTSGSTQRRRKISAR